MLAMMLLTIFTGTVAGIHYDEAWVILQTKRISQGMRPLNGMTHYAGAIHQYLLWPLFEIFGYRVEVLRIFSGIANSLGVILSMMVMKHCYPGNAAYRYVGLLLCTTPAFVAFSRYSGEVQSLNLFLTLSGIWCLICSYEKFKANSRRRETLYSLAGGLLFGILSYNHIIGIVVPLSVAITASIIYNRKLFKPRIFLFVIFGFLLGFSIRLYQLLFTAYRDQWIGKASENSVAGLLHDIPNLPSLLNDLLNGTLVYQRFVGENFLPVIPYLTVSFSLLFIGRCIFLKYRPPQAYEKMFYLFTLTLIFLTIIIAPNFTPHYFQLPLYMMPFILTLFAIPCLTHDLKWLRIASRGLLALIIVLNLFYVSVNYFGRFLATGGTLSIFKIGNRLTETSNSWIRFDTLFDELQQRGVNTVVSDLSIIAPMMIYNVKQPRLKLYGYEKLPKRKRQLDGKTALIFFNGVNLVEKQPIQPPGGNGFSTGSINYCRDNSYDHHFAVFIADPNK